MNMNLKGELVKKRTSRTLFFILLLSPAIALADILVLVHGFHGSGGSWRNKGIVHALASQGWHDSGFYAPLLGNIGYPAQTLSKLEKQLVTAELPSEAPVEIQAELLSQYLKDINQRFPLQSIHLVGHSAGGIVARLALLRNPELPIIQLITIATPHLGSPMAEMAEKASDTPIGFFAPFIGANEINRAEVLFGQLGREKENYFLFWLNRQPHPDIAYISIARASGSLLKGDIYVPPYSQNMAFVPAIGNRSQLLLTPGDHQLKYPDGLLLSRLLP